MHTGSRLPDPPAPVEVPAEPDPALTAAQRLVREQFDTDGYAVISDAVGREAVHSALRLLNLAIRRHGLSADEIASCQQTTFFPHLRWEPEIWALLPPGAGAVLGLVEGDEWAEPQLLLRFPDEAQHWPLQPHVDEPPPWAGGRPYKGIVGVALSDAGAEDGAPCVWPGSHRGEDHERVAVAQRAGDALFMHPGLAHAGTLNLGPTVRSAVYFRLLARERTEAASSSMSMTTPAEGRHPGRGRVAPARETRRAACPDVC